jgi:hypothetical protein
MQINGLVKIIAEIQFTIYGVQRECKAVKRGVTMWMPRWAQAQRFSVQRNGQGRQVRLGA